MTGRGLSRPLLLTVTPLLCLPALRAAAAAASAVAEVLLLLLLLSQSLLISLLQSLPFLGLLFRLVLFAPPLLFLLLVVVGITLRSAT